jgi:hypothetical protein
MMQGQSSLRFEPYPELQAEIDGCQLSLLTPWLTINADVDPAAQSFANYCAKHLHDPQCRKHVSSFLAPFSDYPVAFMRIDGLSHYSETTASHNFNVFAFSKTNIPDEYDGLAALTYFRRKLLSAQSVSESKSPRMDMDFAGKDMAQKMVFQNFYVTSNCDRILEKAIKNYPKFSVALTDFRNDEMGHDKFLQKVIDQIGPWQGGVLAETKKVVALLDQAAELGILPFAMALEIFEGIEFTRKESPLAALVRRNFGDAASRPLQMHYDINRAKKHGLVGQQLILIDPVVRKEELFRAEKLADEFTTALHRLDAAIFGE